MGLEPKSPTPPVSYIFRRLIQGYQPSLARFVAIEESNLGGELPNTSHENVSVPPSQYILLLKLPIGAAASEGIILNLYCS